MSESDFDDIEFFEDLDTGEQPTVVDRPRQPRQPRSGGPPPGGGRRPPGGGGPGAAPVARLGVLVGVAILVIVLLVLWVKSCSGDSKKASYDKYMAAVKVIGDDSRRIGKELSAALITPGIKPAELDAKLKGLATRHDQDVASAEKLSAPAALRPAQAAVVDALKLRSAALRGLGSEFQTWAGSRDVNNASIALATQARRIVASDVIWDDLFVARSLDAMRGKGVTGIAPPDSTFVGTNPEFGSPRYWINIVQRVNSVSPGNQNPNSTGVHGTGLIAVKALPSGITLNAGTENTVTAGTNLGFDVTVKNTGDSQEVQVKVTLTIQQSPQPILSTQTIAVINPNEEKTVRFSNLGQVQYIAKTAVKVDIAPVPNEKSTANNSAEYPVIFSLG